MSKIVEINQEKKRYVLLLNLNNEKCQWDEKLKAMNWHCVYSNNTTEAIRYIKTKLDTELLLDAINRNDYNISAAARELNISRTTFYRLIKKCQIDIKQLKQEVAD